MSARERGGSHYEVVLLLVILIIALTPLDSAGSRPPVGVLLSSVFVFALWTSGASRRVLIAGSILAAAALLVASAGEVAGGDFAHAFFAAAGIALSAGTIVAIFGDLAAQSRVTPSTVTGALSVYLLIGLTFAYLFALIAVLAPHGFFAQHGRHQATDYVYFSYVTLTTVGYGDLTAASNVGRVSALLEALMGQLYLVTIVAVVVGNIGGERSGHLRRAPRGKAREERRVTRED